MRIIIGGLYLESNTFNPFPTTTKSFVLVEGEEVLGRVASTEVFQSAGAEVIPTIYAFGLSSGIVTEETYRFYADKILKVVKEEKEVDGIWLHLHGTMVVENIGSGELQLLKEIREIVGFELPISVAMDPHGNISSEFHQYANIIRAYRTVPHVDQPETEAITARLLVQAIQAKRWTKPVFVRLPLIIGGDTAIGASEPLKSIFNKLEEIERLDGIATASFFVGFSWADTENTASSVVVVPASEDDAALAKHQAQQLAEYVYAKKHLFDFPSVALEPQAAVELALSTSAKPVFISDSGDNTTGGGVGVNTTMLELFLNQQDCNGKKVCIAAILDEAAFAECAEYNVGDPIHLHVGAEYDAHSKKIPVSGILKAKGDLYGYLGCTSDKVGEVYTIAVGNVDVVIANKGDSFITVGHFNAAGLNMDDYDVIVVKQGYLFAELAALAKLHIMALTPGATYQLFHKLEFHHIPRPCYPFDQVESEAN